MSIAPTASRSAGSAKVDWLSQVRKAIKGRPTAGVFYGPPGIGKTSFAASATAPIFVTGQFDLGVETLKSTGQLPEDIPNLPPCKSLADFYSQVDWVATCEHDRKSLVVDNLGDIMSLLHDEVKRRDFGGDQVAYSAYEVGARVNAPNELRQMLIALDRVRDRGMSVLLVGHAIAREIKDPTTANYDKWTPDVSKYCWPVISRWADLVVFQNFVTHVVGTNKEETKKGKARGGQERVMYCTNHAAYEAKNRHNLPDEIPMGGSGAEAWENLINAIKEGRSSNV